jgi:hypothetical protein
MQLYRPPVPKQLEAGMPAYPVADHTPQEWPTAMVKIEEASSDGAIDDGITSLSQDQPGRKRVLFSRPAIGPVD